MYGFPFPSSTYITHSVVEICSHTYIVHVCRTKFNELWSSIYNRIPEFYSVRKKNRVFCRGKEPKEHPVHALQLGLKQPFMVTVTHAAHTHIGYMLIAKQHDDGIRLQLLRNGSLCRA